MKMCGVTRKGAGLLTGVLLFGGGIASADSIRVDDEWLLNVYVQESSQFYQVLFPETGETRQISKKRQDVGEPKLTKDEAERAKLRERWQEAAKEREAVEDRDIQLRTRTQNTLSNVQDGVARERRKLSPAEMAAQQAAWEATLAARQQAMEERERLLAERFGLPMPEEPMLPEEAGGMDEAQMEAPAPGEALPAEPGLPADAGAPGLPPAPPGPRAQPETRPQTAEEIYMEEMQRMQAQPYFGSEQERYRYEQQMQQEMERMQAEAYFWEQRESQEYLDSLGYGGAMTPAIPVQGQASSHDAGGY